MVEDPSAYEDIGLRGFDINIFVKYEEGVVREGCSETYLLMSIMLRPGDRISQLKSMNIKVDLRKMGNH